MKEHAIIPIFIPHFGCPHDCVFCNQKIITARSDQVTCETIENTIDEYLPTLVGRNLKTIEVAFFGGSFTGLPIDKQREFLLVAKKYKDKGIIDKIHISTRPDYINVPILENLKASGVDIIELGVQSFDKEVLEASKRGHSVQDIYTSCDLIKKFNFSLGIQLMIGLPLDTMEKSIASAKETAKIKPDIARLYPTVILENTYLSKMYNEGKYLSLSETDAIATCKEMYKLLFDAKIKLLRVGLKSTDLITNSSDLGGNYHPAFRQLVEGEIAKDALLKVLNKSKEKEITFLSNPKSFSNMIGHKGVNKKYFEEKFPQTKINYNNSLNVPVGIYITDNN